MGVGLVVVVVVGGCGGGWGGIRAGADKVVISRPRPPSDSNTTRINGAAGCPKQAVEMIPPSVMIKPLVSLTHKRLFIFLIQLVSSILD